MANQLSTVEKEIEKILPEDVINALQSGYKVFQGEADQFDDLLKHSGVLIKKAAQRFTTTQLILGIAGVAIVAIIAAKKAADAVSEDDHGTSYDSHKKDAAHTSAKPA
ncbi:hypothetical protein [Hymenobacter sp. BT190]|uniref:hypothetical protein n=1 Tax=Hymenobacter sp. BT190 TaxID=2763505 RepID=UPI0016519D14|nr:hypothetical protein [Hymenobacter sp. BT190]MBC6700407.1 hypothetical protein [Hymenobacter sp. BT190]